MKRHLLLTIVPLLIIAASKELPGRNWRLPSGETVEAKVVVGRRESIVLRIERAMAVELIEVRYRELRETDKRYLSRRYRFRPRPPKTLPRSKNEAFNILDQSPPAYSRNQPGPYPVSLVRAVNYLHRYNEREIVRILDNYVDSRGSEEEAEEAQERVWLIVPLLFERKDKTARFPSPIHGSDDYTLDSKGFWDFHVAVIKDIPFDTRHWGTSGPRTDSSKYLTKWASERGRKRKNKLHPASDIFSAAQTAGGGGPSKESCRRQAWNSVAHLFPLEWQCVFTPELTDERWEALKSLAKTMDVQWSPSKQQYVAKKKSKLRKPPRELIPNSYVRDRKR